MSAHRGLPAPRHRRAGRHIPMTSYAQAMFLHSISPTPQGRRSNADSDPQHELQDTESQPSAQACPTDKSVSQFQSGAQAPTPHTHLQPVA